MDNPIKTPIGRVQPRYCGNYVNNLTYEKLDHVVYNGSTYVALQDVPKNKIPGTVSGSSYWQLIAEKGNQGNTGSFGQPTASASKVAYGENPTVTITASGPDTAKIFNFDFGLPTGPKGFDTVSATASSIGVNNPPNVITKLTTNANNEINLDFKFGIPAANGTGVSTVDGIPVESSVTQNVKLDAVRAVSSQVFTEEQQGYVRQHINAQVAGNYIVSPSDIDSSNPFIKYNGSKYIATTITPSDVGAVPTGRKINNQLLNSDINLTPSHIGAVHSAFKINGISISNPTTSSASINLNPNDIGAIHSALTINNVSISNPTTSSASINLTPSHIGAVHSAFKINGVSISNPTTSNASINLTPSHIGAVHSSFKINGVPITNPTTSNASIQLPTFLTFTNVSVAAAVWTSAGAVWTDQGYNFRADISCSGVTGNMIPQVTFNLKEVSTGNYAAVASTSNGLVRIYATEKPTEDITIPAIICFSSPSSS